MAVLDIIRAEGAFCGVRGVKGGLSRWRGTPEFVAEVLEVFRGDLELLYFFDHRREVGQRADRAERRQHRPVSLNAAPQRVSVRSRLWPETRRGHATESQKNDPHVEPRRLCRASRSKLPEPAAHTRAAPSTRTLSPADRAATDR